MITQLIPQGFCLNCKGCCRFAEADSVWVPCLLNEEIDLLSQKGLPAALITAQKKIRAASFNQESVFICSLFDPQENKCKIYADRPLECQLYPFLLKRKDAKVFLAVDLNCPFVKEKIKTNKFKDYVRQLSVLLKNPQYSAILKNNPHIIQAYPEAEELSEL